MNESPLAPLLRGIVAIAVVVLLVMLLAGCVTPPPAPEPEPPRPAIPADLALTCHDGWFTIYSETAQQALRLPIRCKEA